MKCGGICTSLMSGSLMSAFSRTNGSQIVTGLGISEAISPAGRGLANVNISMNCRKSPGYSRADQAVEGQAHPLDVDVLPVVAHRAAHVHEHRRGALGRVARAVDDDVFGLEPHRQRRPAAQHAR